MGVRGPRDTRRRRSGWQRAARRRERVNHVLGLLIGDQIGMVGQRRNVVANVVRGDDDVALRGKDRSDFEPFPIGVVPRVRDV